MEYICLNRLVNKNCRRDKNAWLEDKIKEAADEAAKKNDSKTLYRIIKDLTGTQSNSNVPIQDKNGHTLAKEEEQNKRWVEHFQEVLSQNNRPPLIFQILLIGPS